MLSPHHGLVDHPGNAAKPEVSEAVVCFVKRIVDYDSHPLPVRIRSTDKCIMKEFEVTQKIGVLSPRYIKRVLFDEYSKLHYNETSSCISRGAFWYYFRKTYRGFEFLSGSSVFVT